MTPNTDKKLRVYFHKIYITCPEVAHRFVEQLKCLLERLTGRTTEAKICSTTITHHHPPSSINSINHAWPLSIIRGRYLTKSITKSGFFAAIQQTSGAMFFTFSQSTNVVVVLLALVYREREGCAPLHQTSFWLPEWQFTWKLPASVISNMNRLAIGCLINNQISDILEYQNQVYHEIPGKFGISLVRLVMYNYRLQ